MPVEPRTDLEERLENLQALTDTALGHLDVDELLTELLRRVVEILDADTAAVLLMDESSQELVARAACGIEDEVRQGVRVPVGVGFAGRIAATRDVHPTRSRRLVDGVESAAVGEGDSGHAGRPTLGE